MPQTVMIVIDEKGLVLNLIDESVKPLKKALQ
jgi:hypothetical protein